MNECCDFKGSEFEFCISSIWPSFLGTQCLPPPSLLPFLLSSKFQSESKEKKENNISTDSGYFLPGETMKAAVVKSEELN